MTDKQMSVMLEMLLKIIKHFTTVDEAVQEIRDLIEADEKSSKNFLSLISI